MRKICDSALLPVAALLAFTGSGTAWGQSEPPGAASQDPSPEAEGGEIVVTAQKKSERLSTVPAAVTVVSSEQLGTAGVAATRDLAARIPSLQVGGGIGSGTFTLRGLNTGQDSSPTVGTQIDGAPIGASTFGSGAASQLPQIDPSTIGRIEVLRGPQGTVYAGNTLGGIVSYVTTDPSLERAEGAAYLEGSGTQAGGGNFVGRAMASAPLIQDKLGIQMSGFVNRQTGFIDAPAARRDNYDFNHAYGGRVALLWQVTPTFRIKLSDLYSDLKSYVSVVDRSSTATQPIGADPTSNEQVLPKYDNRFNAAILNADLDLGSSKLSYVGTLQNAKSKFNVDIGPSSFRGILDALPLFGGVALAPSDAAGAQTLLGMDKVTQELRFASPEDGRLRLLLGAFFSHESTSNNQKEGVVLPDQSSAAGPAGDLLNFNISTHLNEYAGFGNLTFSVTPKLDVTGGIRVSRIVQDYRQTFFGSNAAAYNALFTALGFAAQTSDTGVIKDARWVKTYLANVRYTFSPSTMAYFRFSTGYRVGGPNAVAPGLSPTFGPDSTNNFELGFKTSLLDRKLYLELTAYNIKWRDIQVITVAASGTSGQINGGRATSRGIEANLTAKPMEGLTLNGWVNYSDAKLDEDIITGAGTVGLAGDRLANSPKWSAAFGGEYQHPLNSRLDGFFGWDVRYNGARSAVLAHSTVYPAYTLPSYVIGDLRAGLRYNGYEFMLFARNVGNSRAQLGASIFGYTNVVVQRPRTIGASLSAKF